MKYNKLLQAMRNEISGEFFWNSKDVPRERQLINETSQRLNRCPVLKTVGVS